MIAEETFKTLVRLTREKKKKKKAAVKAKGIARPSDTLGSPGKIVIL